MSDPANDFIRDYQTLARQSWDAWARQLQQPPAAHPFAPAAAQAQASAGNDALERTLAGLKGYFEWMQGAAAGGVGAPSSDWRQQLQQLFGGASQPLAQAFSGIDGAGAEGFTRQWQAWMQAAQQPGVFGDLAGSHGASPAFGLNREQQMLQQDMLSAVTESLQASARYQALIQRANAQGMERLQDKLAEHAEPGRQIDSLKALYDLWVDAAEEAYAEIALTEEFREVYGAMVNTQMRVRQLQQRQTEQLCQQLGVPTRSEVSSLGERLQALRRELRAGNAAAAKDHTDDIASLQRELAALRQRLAASKPAAAGAVPTQPRRSTVKKSVAKPKPRPIAAKKSLTEATPAAARKSAAGKAAVVSRTRTPTVAPAKPRKRK